MPNSHHNGTCWQQPDSGIDKNSNKQAYHNDLGSNGNFAVGVLSAKDEKLHAVAARNNHDHPTRLLLSVLICATYIDTVLSALPVRGASRKCRHSDRVVSTGICIQFKSTSLYQRHMGLHCQLPVMTVCESITKHESIQKNLCLEFICLFSVINDFGSYDWKLYNQLW